MTALLEAKDLVSGYNGMPVTQGVTLSIGVGEVVALLGPNGAGKTTTLLTVSGLLEPVGGSIALFGRVRSGATRHPHRLAREGLAHVPEDRSLFSDLSIEDNLRACFGATRSSIAETLRYFPVLQEITARKASLLSGGEQQMLALARAFASRPRLLVVDELSLGLAPVVVERILPALKALATDTGAGVLLVEQHVDQALELADRAYVMVDGRVVIEGPTADLRRRRDVLALSYLGRAGLHGAA